ncbi:hypothetical protein NBO_2g0050, partial [Nosema bombycis CQ1]
MKISDHATYTIDNDTKECKLSLFTCKLEEGDHVTTNSLQNTTTILSNFNQKALNIANNVQQRLFDRFKAQRNFNNDSSCFYVLNYESCDQFESQQFQNKLLRCFEKYKEVIVSADSIKDYWVETVREINEDTKIVPTTESDLNYLLTIDVENYLPSNSQAFNLENYEINNFIGETQNSTDETNLISNMSFSTFVIAAALLAGS